MRLLLAGGRVYAGGSISYLDVLIEGDRIKSLRRSIPSTEADQTVDLSGKLIVPGFADVHVHLREPGFSYKETIKSGTLAAARGGYTALCSMPNLSPAPDSPDTLAQQTDTIRRDAAVRVYPLATITAGQRGRGELVDFAALAGVAVAFSDDGRGVQDGELMREAMRRVKSVGGIIAAHCEDDSLVGGGYIHNGEYARLNGHAGIPSESEWRQVERDVRLVAETVCRYHVCHVSTRESVEIIRAAKAAGLPVTCETAPHYLALCDMDMSDEGRYKMNPPIRSAADREALIAAAADGTIDVIATDHAPHAADEKDKGLRGSAMGIVGLETAFPVIYTRLVLTGRLTLERALNMMCTSPRRIFGLPGGMAEGELADIAALDTETEYAIDSSEFLSMGRATPFEGWRVRGRSIMTIVNGDVVWRVDQLR